MTIDPKAFDRLAKAIGNGPVTLFIGGKVIAAVGTTGIGVIEKLPDDVGSLDTYNKTRLELI